MELYKKEPSTQSPITRIKRNKREQHRLKAKLHMETTIIARGTRMVGIGYTEKKLRVTAKHP